MEHIIPFVILALIAFLAIGGIIITFIPKRKREEIGIQLPEPDSLKTSHS